MRSSKIITVLFSASISSQAVLAEPIEAGRFAIRCSGNADFSNSSIRGGEPRRSRTGPQIFVIDQDKTLVFRALEPRQEFDPVCGAGRAYISPGMVAASSNQRSDDGTVTNCALTIDRKSGTAKYEMTMTFEGGGFNSFVWDMDCEPAAVPSFDSSRNKF